MTGFVIYLITPGHDDSHFADIIKWIFLNDKFCNSIWIPLKFVPKCPIDNKSALVQVRERQNMGLLWLKKLKPFDLQDIVFIQKGKFYWNFYHSMSVVSHEAGEVSLNFVNIELAA